MSTVFLRRTFRNVVFRDHPYFAHLALTHRCNLRCRFCHVRETKFEELDTEGMKRVIDVLDQMGVGVLSISGGGEPLLRLDVAEIVNYASAKGMYTKITSNGTMPQERYSRLLESSIKEISISLDGVEGNDLPFSHVGPRILDTIRYLHDNLPTGKQLTLNVTVTRTNRARLTQILEHCAEAFPKAKVWLNPVVAGNGSLRTESEPGIDPGYLRQCRSETLLSARFYTEGAEEQYRRGYFNWGCRAGHMFFDVKPNGDFWICQDHPAKTPLNVLDPEFRQQLREADFSHRDRCSGCTYSCYYLTQRGFEPRNWPDMAGMWWFANTRPGEKCRTVAERYGWFLGLLSYCSTRGSVSMARAAAVLLAVLLAAGPLVGQCASTPPDAESMLSRMEQFHARQREELTTYQSTRRYLAGNTRLRVQAEVVATVYYRAPGTKTFAVLSRTGSRSVQTRVIEPAMDAESRTTAPLLRADTEISRRNYTFTLAGFDEDARAYVFAAEPLRLDPYLFRGRVWLDGQTCAIHRVAGQPVRSPSFWVKRVQFVQQYGDLGGYWLPVHHETQAELRLFGRSRFAIDYFDYSLEGRGLPLLP